MSAGFLCARRRHCWCWRCRAGGAEWAKEAAESLVFPFIRFAGALLKRGKKVGGRKNKSLSSASTQKQEAGSPIKCHVRTSPLPRALFVFRNHDFSSIRSVWQASCAFRGTTPLSNDDVTVTEVFIVGDALSDLIRRTRFPAKTPTQQPRVGDYSCLYFISFGSIFILFTFFFSHHKSAYKKPFTLESEGHEGGRCRQGSGMMIITVFRYLVALRSFFLGTLFFLLIVFAKQETETDTIFVGTLGNLFSSCYPEWRLKPSGEGLWVTSMVDECESAIFSEKFPKLHVLSSLNWFQHLKVGIASTA